MTFFKKITFIPTTIFTLTFTFNAMAEEVPRSTPPAHLDQAIHRVGENLEKNPNNPGLNNAIERLERNQDRIEQKTSDRPDRVERQEKVERVERLEKIERVDRPEHVDRLDRVEHIDRPEHLDRPGRN